MHGIKLLKMLSIFNRRRVTNNMQIRSEIVSKFSNAWKFLNKQQVRTYCEARRSFNVRKKADRKKKNSVLKSGCLLRKLKHWTYCKTTVVASNIDPSLHLKQRFSQHPRKSLIIKHEVCNRSMISSKRQCIASCFLFHREKTFFH